MAKFAKDTTPKELLEDSGASEVLKKYYPVDTSNPLMGLAYGMTLEKCLSFPQVGLTDEQKQQIYEELEALG